MQTFSLKNFKNKTWNIFFAKSCFLIRVKKIFSYSFFMKKIYLIDWNSFIYRMFFGLPEFSTKSWKIVNATFGMAKFFVWQLTKENPDYLIFIKDAKWDNFRHKIYADYKATRDRMPDNLKVQISDIETMIKKMWVKIVEVDWYEADDIIWTLSTRFGKQFEIDILTGDKDLFSLVNENVKIYDTMKKQKFGISETKEKFGVEPNKIIDYLAICWDKSDNIPWIESFWPAKACDLINNIWWIEEIYNLLEKAWNEEKEILAYLKENFPEEKVKIVWKYFKWKSLEKLLQSKAVAFLSKKLATVDLSVNFEFNLEDFSFKKDNLLNDEVKAFFKEFEFFSLLWEEEQKSIKKWQNLGLKVNIISEDEELEKLFEKIIPLPSPPLPKEGEIREKNKKIILDTETTSLNITEAELVWVSIFLDEKNIFYINRLHHWQKVSDFKLKEFLNKLLNLDILIIWHNIKYDLEIIELFLNQGKQINQSLFDESKITQTSLF